MWLTLVLILLSQSSQCWSYRHMLSCLVSVASTAYLGFQGQWGFHVVLGIKVGSMHLPAGT